MGFDSKCDFVPPAVLLGLLPVLGCGVSPQRHTSATQPPHWERVILATGPPGLSPRVFWVAHMFPEMEGSCPNLENKQGWVTAELPAPTSRVLTEAWHTLTHEKCSDGLPRTLRLDRKGGFLSFAPLCPFLGRRPQQAWWSSVPGL